jgi:tetratricopeptide (TPR) repeat protein
MSLITDALKTAQREKGRRTGASEERTGSGRSFLSVRTRAGSGFGRMSSPVMVASALLAGMVAVLIAVVVLTSMRKRNDRARLAASTSVATAQRPVVSETAPALFGASPPASEVIEEPPPSYANGELSSTPYPNPRYAEDQQPVPVADEVGVPVETSSEADARVPADVALADAALADAAPAVAVARPALAASQPPRATPIRPGALTITMQDPVALAANPYVQQAIGAQRRGDLVSAQELYAKALALSPDNAELHNNLGALHRTLGSLQQAEEAYRRAIALDRTLASAWSNLGVVLDARGRGREATGAFQESMRLDPANAATKVNLAIQYHASGLLQDARNLLEDAIRKDPSMSEAHYALARVLESQGVRARAVREYNLFLTTSAGRFPELEERVRRHINQLTANAG